MTDAPGWPGIPPRWTSSAKTGVGTALSPVSRVWFTISHGILNEIYYPRVDQACTRDFGLIVTDGDGFFAEEKRDCTSAIEALEDGVPAFQHDQHPYRRALPHHQARVHRSAPRRGAAADPVRAAARPAHCGCSPACAASGQRRRAQHRLDRQLQGPDDAVRRGRRHLAGAGCVFCRFLACSVGFVGRQRRLAAAAAATATLTVHYDRAADGNVALTAELDLSDRADRAGARLRPQRRPRRRSACAPACNRRWTRCWRNTPQTGAPGRQGCARSTGRSNGHNTYRISTAVLRCHESPTFPGGLIASLSIPWGASKGDDDLGGYHLVWPRDLVQTAGALPGLRRARRGAARAALPARGAGGGRTLAAELLAGRHGVLARRCSSTSAPSRSCWWRWPGANGAVGQPQLAAFWPMVRARRRLRRAQRPDDRPGPLGGGRRLYAVHPRRGDRRPAGRRRSGGALRRRRTWPGSCAIPPTLERADRDLDLRRGHRAGADVRRGRAITCASCRSVPGEAAAAQTRAMVALRNRPPGRRCAAGDGAGQRRMRWPWCGSACARPTIRACWTR